jgi:16S rRNA processing protein RimM
MPDGDAGGSYTVEEAAVSGTGVLLKFNGIDSPEKAKTLAGYELVVDRADAARLGPGEYYVEDLRGLAVAALRNGGNAAPDDPALEVLGRVTDIIEGGGGLLLEMRPERGAVLPAGGSPADGSPVGGGKDGPARETARLIPFRHEFFGEISLEHGVIVLLSRWIVE